jgi:UDP-glucose 4-epimerase
MTRLSTYELCPKEKEVKMEILIIGGAGFLGCHLVRHCLRDLDNQVTVLDSLEPKLRSTTDGLKEVWGCIEFIQGDMRDEALMAQIVQDKDIIFNCAAQTSHPLSLQDPLFDTEINCIGNIKLLEAIRQHNKNAVVVFTSSSTAVGRSLGEIIDENHYERPLDIYSANKGVAEKYYRIYHAVHDLKTIVLRFANLYGPYGKGYSEFGFVNYFIHQAWHGKDITVYGSGQQTRNIMFAEDAAEILYRSAFNPCLYGQMFFAVHDEHLSVLEVAQTIVSVFDRGRVVQVEWPDVRKRFEINEARISSRQLRAITGWKPQYSFAAGLAKVKRVMSRYEYA